MTDHPTSNPGQGVQGAPIDRPYGVHEFGVRDLNGISIVFGQDIGADPAAESY